MSAPVGFPRPRPLAENFEDQCGAIQNLCRPRLFEIALLHRRELCVDDDDLGLRIARHSADLCNLAASHERCGNRPSKRHNELLHHFEADRGRQADGLGKTRPCVTLARSTELPALGLHMNDKGSTRLRRAASALADVYAVSAVAGASSWSWIGPSGMTVEIACL
jgi:hypothetical protein